MTYKHLIAYWPQTVAKHIKRWWLRRQLDHIGYTLKHIAMQRENDRQVERILQRQQALIQSDMRLL